MKLTYCFLPGPRVILERIEGPVDLESLKKGIVSVWEHPNYHTSYGGLMDLRNADFLMSPADLAEVTGLLTSSQTAATGPLVLLVDKPFETALSMLYENKMAALQSVHIYCEAENALDFFHLTEETLSELDSPDAVRVQFTPAALDQKIS